MQLFERLWTTLTQFLSIASLSPLQKPLAPADHVPVSIPISPGYHDTRPGPIFKPPGGLPQGDGSEFQCDYTAMTGFIECSTKYDRGCWLVDPLHINNRWDINTNYEGTTANGDALMPKGIVRPYTLIVSENNINADGLNFTEGKTFNGSYPGPWIQACWGDLIEITVINKLKYNGTSIHWHGIRQWLSMHMDGVNGITQCPIAPNDTFVYRFNATQYGSSWYHSHYSIQYADGLVGPITIHGPSSRPYDVAPDMPLLMTDWIHNSAFEAITDHHFANASILLNGIGDVNLWSETGKNIVPPSDIPTPYTLTFNKTDPPTKYLLRLINTSFRTTFVFSIDNHLLNVVGVDFVPIHNYSTTSVVVGIGQRYHVIVEAAPQPNGAYPPVTDGNFWIRTSVPRDCTDGHGPPPNPAYNQTGILRYDNTSTATPTSNSWDDANLRECADEPYASMTPVVAWTLAPPVNGNGRGENELITDGVTNVTNFSLAYFALNPIEVTDLQPLQIDYGDPTFLELNNTADWKPRWVIIPEDYNATSWIQITITDGTSSGPHPIHIHGHDFAILQRSEASLTNPPRYTLNTVNPPRRDVVLIPAGGFVVVAFKTDNPGAWLVHCHIAEHAASGLGMQIMERREDAVARWPSYNASTAIKEATRVCKMWKAWQSKCENWYSGCSADPFQDDSGV
ncbi:multicopper oxidase-domain-containing protein [Podospora didyma]|uniref:Multicopper oxidase-domain-containing protein n=1 Tax=Podospora didyma TaxID=330526 RepID=A0AAE0NTP9_9PEZI|nr:multicopper oxidase-domain-containing protein [Podospora didyma]